MLTLLFVTALAAEPVQLGLSASVGLQAHPEGVGPTTDLGAIELRIPTRNRERVELNVDLVQLATTSVLSTRQRGGLGIWYGGTLPSVHPIALAGSLGLDTELGADSLVVDEAVVYRPGGAIGLGSRIGFETTGPSERFRFGLHLRSAVGVDLSHEGTSLFGRATLETTFVWSVRRRP